MLAAAAETRNRDCNRMVAEMLQVMRSWKPTGVFSLRTAMVDIWTLTTGRIHRTLLSPIANLDATRRRLFDQQDRMFRRARSMQWLDLAGLSAVCLWPASRGRAGLSIDAGPIKSCARMKKDHVLYSYTALTIQIRQNAGVHGRKQGGRIPALIPFSPPPRGHCYGKEVQPLTFVVRASG